MEWDRFPLRFSLVVNLLISLAVGGVVSGIRQLGWLEPLELAVYDWGHGRKSPSLSASARIALIAINEDDIRRQGRWPLSDATLAQALQILTRYRPRAIGIDLFRDLAVPPGEQTLTKVLLASPNIVVVSKAGGLAEHAVPPPPILKNTDQVGFADVVLDRGGVVRRGLLYLTEGETMATSFALRLSLLYLRAEGIAQQPDLTNPEHLRLGRVTIPPFEANDGGYISADARGYQFLLDIQAAERTFPTFRLTTLLEEKIAPEAMRDKIVLVGTVADSIKDLFFIPSRSIFYTRSTISGVELHAHITDQLLRGALEGGAPPTSVSERWESGWLLLWCVMGGIIGTVSRWPLWFWSTAFGGLVILGVSVYWAFVQNWWIPFVPPAIGWVLSIGLAREYLLAKKKENV